VRFLERLDHPSVSPQDLLDTFRAIPSLPIPVR
jgi:hypothetical protein